MPPSFAGTLEWVSVCLVVWQETGVSVYLVVWQETGVSVYLIVWQGN